MKGLLYTDILPILLSAIFISKDITRERGGVTFGTPCITHDMHIFINKCVLKRKKLHNGSIIELTSFADLAINKV